MNFQASSPGTSLNAQFLTQISGAFYGDALDQIQLEAQIARFWKPVWIDWERRAIRRCWFDYRHCHPALRSHFFFYQYTLAYRRAYRRFYDSNANVTNMRPFKGVRNLYTLKPMALVQVINTMHFVDESRLPYDVFFDGTIEHFMQKREFTSKWNKKGGLTGAKLPPLNLLKDGQALIAAQTLFDRRNLTRLRFATHPHYMAESWRGMSSQKEHIEYLFNEARRREGNIKHVLKAMTYDLGLVREHEVARRFGLEMVKEIRTIRDC